MSACVYDLLDCLSVRLSACIMSQRLALRQKVIGKQRNASLFNFFMESLLIFLLHCASSHTFSHTHTYARICGYFCVPVFTCKNAQMCIRYAVPLLLLLAAFILIFTEWLRIPCANTERYIYTADAFETSTKKFIQQQVHICIHIYKGN